MPLIGVNDVARLLGVSRDTVYRLLRDDELASYRVGRRLRFRTDELAAYIELHREGGSR